MEIKMGAPAKNNEKKQSATLLDPYRAALPFWGQTQYLELDSDIRIKSNQIKSKQSKAKQS